MKSVFIYLFGHWFQWCTLLSRDFQPYETPPEVNDPKNKMNNNKKKRKLKFRAGTGYHYI